MEAFLASKSFQQILIQIETKLPDGKIWVCQLDNKI